MSRCAEPSSCVRGSSGGCPLDGAVGELVIIHELLHALGLGENPPTSHEIVALVWRRCGAVLTRPPPPSPAPGSSERAPVFEPVDGHCFSGRWVLIPTAPFETRCSLRGGRQAAERADADFQKVHKLAFDTLVGSGKKAKTFYFMESHTVTHILTIMTKLDKDLETPFLGFSRRGCPSTPLRRLTASS